MRKQAVAQMTPSKRSTTKDCFAAREKERLNDEAMQRMASERTRLEHERLVQALSPLTSPFSSCVRPPACKRFTRKRLARMRANAHGSRCLCPPRVAAPTHIAFAVFVHLSYPPISRLLSDLPPISLPGLWACVALPTRGGPAPSRPRTCPSAQRSLPRSSQSSRGSTGPDPPRRWACAGRWGTSLPRHAPTRRSRTDPDRSRPSPLLCGSRPKSPAPRSGVRKPVLPITRAGDRGARGRGPTRRATLGATPHAPRPCYCLSRGAGIYESGRLLAY